MAFNPLDKFFNLGNKATRGDPVRKAQFDYYLYWILFLAFVYVAVHYYYLFFVTWKFTSLMWGLILSVITWFNYWGLVGFKTMYDSQKRTYENLKKLGVSEKQSDELAFDKDSNPKDMLDEFGDDNKFKEVKKDE